MKTEGKMWISYHQYFYSVLFLLYNILEKLCNIFIVYFHHHLDFIMEYDNI